jgi:biofilm protein TabA
MICDKFENMNLYFKEGDALYKAIVYARDFDRSLPDGVHEVEGRDIFAKMVSYDTSPAEERKFESHKHYADVQVILEGAERMDVFQEQDMEPLEAYQEKDDVTMLNAPETYSSLAMTSGMFAVFFPQDIHRPNCNLNGKTRNRKICMKVKIK